MRVLLLVVPVVKWDGVSPGMTEATVSWIVKGNLTQLDLICQVSVIAGRNTEVGLTCYSSDIHYLSAFFLSHALSVSNS